MVTVPKVLVFTIFQLFFIAIRSDASSDITGIRLYRSIRSVSDENSNETALAQPDAGGIIARTFQRLMDILLWPMRMLFRIIEAPFHLAKRIYVDVTTPISMLYTTITFPIKILWRLRHGLQGLADNYTLSRNATNGNGTTGMDAFGAVGLKILQLFGNDTNESFSQKAFNIWSMLKSDVIPQIDNYIQDYQNSNDLSDDVKDWMSKFHNAYKLVHLLGII